MEANTLAFGQLSPFLVRFIFYNNEYNQYFKFHKKYYVIS